MAYGYPWMVGLAVGMERVTGKAEPLGCCSHQSLVESVHGDQLHTFELQIQTVGWLQLVNHHLQSGVQKSRRSQSLPHVKDVRSGSSFVAPNRRL